MNDSRLLLQEFHTLLTEYGEKWFATTDTYRKSLIRRIEAELTSRPEVAATLAALAMEGAPTIKDRIMRSMRDHYWDSLEPQKDLVIAHIDGALRWMHQSSDGERDA